MELDPQNTSYNDLAQAALTECGAFGLGRRPRAEDVSKAVSRMLWMLQQWERKRWLVYHLVNLAVVSTGEISYFIGPGAGTFGGFETGANSVRPAKIESAFVRQLQQPGIQSQNSIPNNVDYRLAIMQSREDYDKITLKTLKAGPGEAIFLDSAWPLGNVYVWPVPQAAIYEIHVTVREQLPTNAPSFAYTFTLPYEYYAAIMYNTAMRLRGPYQIATFPGDPLPGMARDSLAVLRGPNTQIAKLRMPTSIMRRGLYNIFSDRPY